MKKLLLSLLITAIVLSASQAFAAKKWQLYFKAQQEIVAVLDGENVLGYKLGPNDTIVQTNQVIDILQIGNIHCILYLTDNISIASQVRTWTEFMGFGYTDMIWRIALGLGPDGGPTLDHVKYLTGAHWYLNGEWHFGSIKDWEAIDPLPLNVYFGPIRQIMGIPLQ